MKRIEINFNIAIMVAFLIGQFSCAKRPETQELQSSQVASHGIPIVNVSILNYRSFEHEIISNGTLRAVRRADLMFSESKNIIRVHVSNGDHVKKGDKIAELDSFLTSHSLKQSLEQLKRSEVEFRDILLKMGFNPDDTGKLSTEIIKSAKVISNYNKSQMDVEMERFKFNALVLRSPIPGVITNLFTKESNYSSNSEIFCSVIDDNEFEAEFSILESELELATPNTDVTIVPNSNNQLSIPGKIVRINPIVDSNGLIMCHAVCHNRNSKLFEGMSVTVVIRKQIQDQLAIPNSAILSKNGKDVAFIFDNGFAKWRDIKIGDQNSEFTIITDGLNPADTVIIDGNLNLSNNSKVEISQ